MVRFKFAMSALVLVAAVVAAIVLPVGRWLLDLVEQIRQTGGWGIAVYSVMYVAATVALLPGSLLTIGAGFLYGLAGGIAVVVPSAIAGATVAFLLGRSIARDWVHSQVARRPRMAAIDQAIAERSLLVVFLLRLSPLFPFNLLNYALSLTRARLREYVVATAAGILPGSILYCYIGTTLTDLVALQAGAPLDTGVAGRVLLWFGLAATLLVTVLISKLARARLQRALRQ
ncbi:MAG: TVP38/TMEM64 family protein [Proteobacteria bacterium]|nr:TVP38/TMEM64 family protein [Pseudomonadota bacterium]